MGSMCIASAPRTLRFASLRAASPALRFPIASSAVAKTSRITAVSPKLTRFHSCPPRHHVRRASPLDLPSSLVQLRSAVWTGDTRDTRPDSDIGLRRGHAGGTIQSEHPAAPRFRTIQVGPKDRLTLPPAGLRAASQPAHGDRLLVLWSAAQGRRRPMSDLTRREFITLLGGAAVVLIVISGEEPVAGTGPRVPEGLEIRA